MKDTLGDRMKEYERRYTYKCIPLLPICVRIDGKNFSKWTKGLARPYDIEMCDLMLKVTEFLVTETQASIGYTQSDEISLVYYSKNTKSQLFFDGKPQKMCSVLCSMATMKFNELLQEKRAVFDRFRKKPPVLFDCRVWQVPTLEEAANYILWRELDATKNSITMAASEYYSNKQLLGKHSGAKMDMLMDVGVNWNDYPAYFKRGMYVRRFQISTKLTDVELAKLPEKHNMRRNPDMSVIRNMIIGTELPIFSKITNRIDVIFNGGHPIVG